MTDQQLRKIANDIVCAVSVGDHAGAVRIPRNLIGEDDDFHCLVCNTRPCKWPKGNFVRLNHRAGTEYRMVPVPDEVLEARKRRCVLVTPKKKLRVQ